MKYVHTLHINAKEIEILNEAMKLYKEVCNQKMLRENFYPNNKEGFISLRSKVINMSQCFEEIKNLAKPVVSEAGKIPESQK